MRKNVEDFPGNLDVFCREALKQGLEYHESQPEAGKYPGYESAAWPGIFHD